jgi:hypothetical protein
MRLTASTFRCRLETTRPICEHVWHSLAFVWPHSNLMLNVLCLERHTIRNRAHVTFNCPLSFTLEKGKLGVGFPTADIGHNDLICFVKLCLKCI